MTNRETRRGFNLALIAGFFLAVLLLATPARPAVEEDKVQDGPDGFPTGTFNPTPPEVMTPHSTLQIGALIRGRSGGGFDVSAATGGYICAYSADPVTCCQQIAKSVCGYHDGCFRNKVEQCILESR